MRRLAGIVLLAVTALGGATAVKAAPLQVYSNNFDGTETFGGGATGGLFLITTTAGVQNFSTLANPGNPGNTFSGNLLRNDDTNLPTTPTVIHLSNLPAHDSVSLSFLLAIIDSWDSSNGAPSPDIFNVVVDGNYVLTATFANQSGTITDTVGTSLTNLMDLWSGPSGPHFNDRAYDVTGDARLTSIAHTASTLTVELFASGSGWQGGTDESWGIDNLAVTINATATVPVPEPMPLAALGLGLAGIWLMRRRRRG